MERRNNYYNYKGNNNDYFHNDDSNFKDKNYNNSYYHYKNSKKKYNDYDDYDDIYEDNYDQYYNNDYYNDDYYYDDYYNDDDDYYNEDDYDDDYDGENDYYDYYSQRQYEDDKSLIFRKNFGFTQKVNEMIDDSKINDVTGKYVNVLMIAEKPSIAKIITSILSNNKYKNKSEKYGRPVYTFEGYFQYSNAHFTVSAVAGHLYSTDFLSEHNDWDAIEPGDLFDVSIIKRNEYEVEDIPEMLQTLAKNQDILCLWLDCDNEGENICYEVIYNVLPYMNKRNYQQIFRAKFSSLTESDLGDAFEMLSELPDKNVSLSVDARQAIDLKVGVSLSRYLTREILPVLKGLPESCHTISYGPCQTPTLWFCVNRQNEIDNYKPSFYYQIFAEIVIDEEVHTVSMNQTFKNRNEAIKLLEKIKNYKKIKVKEVEKKQRFIAPPEGLNTTSLLKIASTNLKMSPHKAMAIAENLYSRGYISYPRTETTKYSSSFDFEKNLKDITSNSDLSLLLNEEERNIDSATMRGIDEGDHPPITPSKSAKKDKLSKEQWELYECICSNYFASLSDSLEYEQIKYTLEIDNNDFECSSSKIIKEGFIKFQPYKKEKYNKEFPKMEKNAEYIIKKISLERKETERPEYITEEELIEEMEKNHIGTDASMHIHINNICRRKYVRVDDNRHLIPTKLGKALIEALMSVVPDLVKPENRAKIEEMVNEIAKGQKKYEETMENALQFYKQKFNLVKYHHDALLDAFGKHFNFEEE